MNQFPPRPRVSQQDHFKFFRKFAEIFAAQDAPQVSLTLVANGKKRKFLLFLWTPLGSKVSIQINFFIQVRFKLSAADNWSHCLTPVSLIPVVHLDSRISPRIFEKILNGPNGIPPETESWKKNRSKKSCDTVPLKVVTSEKQGGFSFYLAAISFSAHSSPIISHWPVD